MSRRITYFTLAALLAGALQLPAQLALPIASPPAPEIERTERPRHGKWWKVSVVLLAAASAADAQSSWGRLEANPLLRNGDGRFGSQGIALKALIVGGAVGTQYLLLRKHPKAEKYGIITNAMMAGVLTSVAISNHERARRQPAGE